MPLKILYDNINFHIKMDFFFNFQNLSIFDFFFFILFPIPILSREMNFIDIEYHFRYVKRLSKWKEWNSLDLCVSKYLYKRVKSLYGRLSEINVGKLAKFDIFTRLIVIMSWNKVLAVSCNMRSWMKSRHRIERRDIWWFF